MGANPRRRRIVVLLIAHAIAVCALGISAWLSWFTTLFSAQACVDGGQRLTVRVVDREGLALRGSRLDLVVEPPALRQRLFVELGDGPIVSDTGIHRLTIPKEGWRYDADGWDLFWCIRIWDVRPLPERAVLRLSAQGVGSKTITVRTLLDKKDVTISLGVPDS